MDWEPVFPIVVLPVLVTPPYGHWHVHDKLTIAVLEKGPAQLGDPRGPIWAQTADERLPAISRADVVVAPLLMSSWCWSNAARGLSAPVVW